MNRASIIALTTVALSSCVHTFAIEQKDSTFTVTVTRDATKDGLVFGTLRVDGKELGKCYENDAKKIPAGKYLGKLRYTSSKNFVQGPGGKLGKTGDFLLEVSNVPNRTHILFHAGDKPEHSEGCIMLGPATRPNGSTHPMAPTALKELRLLFYDGNDMPDSTPNKEIQIEIIESK